jgi:solute carrier family 35 (GDP-fucose transporter), member C1
VTIYGPGALTSSAPFHFATPLPTTPTRHPQYVEVSFYNVARSLTIVFNVIFTYMMLGEVTSRTTLICLGMVIVGFFVGSGGEVNFSLIGTLFGVSSSVFVSLNSIYTKKVMPIVDGNQWTLAAYNNMNAVLMFIPIILVVERDVLLANLHVMTQGYYWMLMWIGGGFGFLIGIVTILQIKLTSPLTHNISGTAKAGVQTVLALAIWQNPTTPANLAGIALVLAGSFLYAYVRNREMESTNTRRLAAKATTAAGGGDAATPAKAEGGADGAPAPAAADGSSGAADEKETAGLLERGAAAESKA